MKKLHIALVILLTFLCQQAVASSWPPYENTVRFWGTASEIYSTSTPVGPWVAFILKLPDSTEARFDCGTQAVALACNLINQGDSILVSGHLDDRLSCHQDGIDNFAVPNIIFRCNTGTCVQLTP
jgi:hypothetical protein